MKFLGNIDELKDIVTKNHVDKMAGKQFMYPIYLPSSADTPISDEQKAVNKEAFDAYSEYVARDYADPYICLYVADMPKNMLVLPFESLNDNGELASLDVFGNISMFGGYSGIESMYNLFFGGTIMPDGSVVNVEDANLAFEVPTINSFKTINGKSIIGTGNIVIDGGSDIDVSLLATKAELAEAEEVYAAAVNQLNIRIMALEAALRNM